MRMRLAERDCDGNMLRWQRSSLRLFHTPLEDKNSMQTPTCSMYSQAETCRVQTASPLALWRWDATGTTYTVLAPLEFSLSEKTCNWPQCLSSTEEQTAEDLTWHIIFHNIHLSLTLHVDLHTAIQARSKGFISGVFSGLWRPPTITLYFIHGQEGGKSPERVGTRCKIRT